MKLGFSVEDLLPRARGGGALRMGLTTLTENEWLQPEPDLACREAAFDAFPGAVQVEPRARAAGEEVAAMLDVAGGLEQAARASWEDMCILLRDEDDEIYRLAGAAVAFPTDWHPADKMGLPLTGLHKPIHGYRQQLASSVDHFMAKLKPGRIFGRSNWFVAPTDSLRWVGEPPEKAFANVTPDNAGETLFVRCERQTLRRLPQTGAILFTIGIYLSPLGALSPANIDRVAKAVAAVPPEEAERRGTPFYGTALRDYAARHGEAALPAC
jgi:hypothetical protein